MPPADRAPLAIDAKQTLRTLAEKLRQDLVEKRKREIEPMLKISNDQSERITRIQNEIVEKVKKNRDTLQEVEKESKEIADRFGSFFERRVETEKLGSLALPRLATGRGRSSCSRNFHRGRRRPRPRPSAPLGDGA